MGMNNKMASIVGEGLTLSTVAALGSGPLAPVAAILAFPMGITEGLIYEAFFADELEDLLDYLSDDFSEYTCH